MSDKKAQFESLEDRILMSASPIDSSESAIHASNEIQQIETNTIKITELLVIDTSVDGYENLIENLDHPNLEIHFIDFNSNGIEELSKILAQHENLNSLHIISHGSDGEIQLGSESLNSETIQQYQDEVKGWADSFSDDGDILIYGCDVAASDQGKDLIARIAHLTDTDVAASDDITGFNGDILLEYANGTIDSKTLIEQGDFQKAKITLNALSGDFETRFTFEDEGTSPDGYTLSDDGLLQGEFIGDVTYVDGVNEGGRAIYFDGQQDALTIQDADDNSNVDLSQIIGKTASISLYIKTEMNATNNPSHFTGPNIGWNRPSIVGNEHRGGTLDVQWGWIGNDGRINIGVGNETIATSTTVVSDNEWHHIVFSRDQATGVMSLYIDGVLEDSGTPSGNNRNADLVGFAFSHFGQTTDSSGSGHRYYQGAMDNIVIVDRVFNSDEIAILNSQPSVEIDADVNGDGVLTIDEESLGDKIDITVTIPAAALEGDTLTVSVEGGSEITHTLTAFEVMTDTVELSVDNPGNGQNLRITAQITDQNGNQSLISTVESAVININANISLNAITSDNILSTSETAQTQTLTGSVSGDAQAGDTVTLTVNGQDYTTTVQNDLTYSFSIPGSELAADSDHVASIAVTVNDSAGNPITFTNTHSYSVNSKASLSVDTTPTGYNLSSAAVPVDSNITISDLDTDNIYANSSVRISGNFQVGDLLTFTDNLGFSGSYDASTGVLSITSSNDANATLENYEAFLQSISFSTTSSEISVRTIEFNANDGIENADAVTRDLYVLNERPPQVLSISTDKSVVSEGQALTVTVTLDDVARPGGELVQINFDTSAANSTDSSDSSFAGLTTGNFLFIPEGQTSAQFTINITDDADYEAIESLVIEAKTNLVYNANFEMGADGFTAREGTVLQNAQDIGYTGNSLRGLNRHAGGLHTFEINRERVYLRGSETPNNLVIEIDVESQGFQNLKLTPGQEYTVSFDWVTRQKANGGNADLIVKTFNVSDMSESGSHTVSYTRGDSGWTNTSFTFTPTEDITRLEFTGTDFNTLGVLLDNLTITSNGFPEATSSSVDVHELAPENLRAPQGPFTTNVLDNEDGSIIYTIQSFQIAGDNTVYTAGQTATISGIGTVTLESDGSYTFTPDDNNWLGHLPEMTYTSQDGQQTTFNLESYDSIAPTAQVDFTESNLKNGENSQVTFSFSEEITSFDTSDLTVVGGAVSNLSTSDNITFTATFTPSLNYEGTASVTINDKSYTDIEGNEGSSAADTIQVDTLAPTAVISIDQDITSDDIINDAERGQNINITGSVGGDVKAGDTIILKVNGKTFTGSVLPDYTFSIAVPGTDLVADGDNEIEALVTIYDLAGNSATAQDTETYSVDIVAPNVSINLDTDITSDDVINIAESGQNIDITGSVGGDAVAGDIVRLSINGNVYSGFVLNDLSFSISVSGADLAADADSSINAYITTMDLAGNTASASDSESFTVDTLAPSFYIDLDQDITSDDIINIAESGQNIQISGRVGGEVNIGDTVQLRINGNMYTTTVLADYSFNVSVTGADLVADSDSTIEAFITTSDQAGNTATASDTETYSVDIMAPNISITIDQNITDDDIINKAESRRPVEITGSVNGEVNVGDTVILQVNGRNFTGSVLRDYTFSIDVPGRALVADADSEIKAFVTSQDLAGNSSSTSDVESYSLDLTAPSFDSDSGFTFRYFERQTEGALVGSVNLLGDHDSQSIAFVHTDSSMSPISEDGFYRIDSDGNIYLTALGANKNSPSNDYERGPKRFNHTITISDAAGNTSVQDLRFVVKDVAEGSLNGREGREARESRENRQERRSILDIDEPEYTRADKGPQFEILTALRPIIPPEFKDFLVTESKMEIHTNISDDFLVAIQRAFSNRIDQNKEVADDDSIEYRGNYYDESSLSPEQIQFIDSLLESYEDFMSQDSQSEDNEELLAENEPSFSFMEALSSDLEFSVDNEVKLSQDDLDSRLSLEDTMNGDFKIV